MSDETNNTDPQANPSANNQSQEAPDLGLQDLVTIKSIIDVASSRGAFKPNEMVAVGQTYTKLSTFLEAVQKQSDAQKGAQPTQPDAGAAAAAGLGV